MKNLNKLAATLGMVLMCAVSYAQVTLTPYVGLLHSNTKINSALIQPKGLSTGVVGIHADYALDKNLSIRSGIKKTRRGFEVGATTGIDLLGASIPVGVKASTEIDYIEVPLMLKYNINSGSKIRPYIGLGTGLSYATKGNIRTKATAIIDFTLSSTELQLDSPDYNRTLAMGYALAGVEIPYGKNGHWIIEVDHSRSFTDFVSEDFLIGAGGRHSGVGINVGYGIRF